MFRASCLAALIVLQTGWVATAFADRAKDEWQEEILLQLSELRKAQGELAKQVSELKAQLQAQDPAKKAAAVSLDLRKEKFPVYGDANASVAILEFSDFECPYCRRHQKSTVPSLREKYVNSGKVKYLFADFPLSFHSHAEPAAIAAACANRQGEFWKMHDMLFEDQGALDEQAFLKFASNLHLNDGEFKLCLKDPKIAAQVRANAQLGESVGVQGTPAFLIGRVRNGVLVDAQLVSGAQPLANFERVLDPLLSDK